MTPAARPWTVAACAGFAALLAVVIYWPALDARFVGDDFMILHRLRDLSGPMDAPRFFRGEFFEYYRPLGFLSHALDWAIAGADARQFHRTNLGLHAANTVLVLLIARALVLGSSGHVDPDAAGASATTSRPAAALLGGTIAALLFALHASNHEAVVWVSARFDLLATFWTLAAIWWMVTGGPSAVLGAPLLFAAAVLSKESAVALPVGAAAWAVFCLRSTTLDAVRRLLPWIVVLAGYALARQLAGGVSATGGRLPKLAVLLVALAALVAGADGRWLRVRRGVVDFPNRPVVIVAIVLCLALGGLWAFKSDGVAPALIGEKLAVAGFALVYLVLPVTDVNAGPGFPVTLETFYQRAALFGVPAALLLVSALRRRLTADDRAWFLGALLLAVLLPISALTEGRRYLYLPSAVVSVAMGVAVVHLRREWKVAGAAVLAGTIAISGVRIVSKTQDWIWAGRMTADGARLVDDALAPACNEGDVVFLTSPVGVRGVYSHFYYETFELPRGCMPATFHVVARLLRVDTRVDVERIGREEVVLTIPGYRGNLVLSEDLRRFDLPLPASGARDVQTPLGRVRAQAAGSDMRLTLQMLPEARNRTFFYYSESRIRRLALQPGLQ